MNPYQPSSAAAPSPPSSPPSSEPENLGRFSRFFGNKLGLQHEKTWWLEVGLNEENYTWIQQKCEFNPAKIVNSVWLGQKTMAIKPAKMGTAPGKKNILSGKHVHLNRRKWWFTWTRKKGAKTCIHWVLLAQPKKKPARMEFCSQQYNCSC